MKRIACLLSFSLTLLGAFHGVAAAQQLSGLTGPLDGNSEPLDQVKKPVDDVTNEVEDSADNVVEDSSEVAEDAGGTAGSVADEPTQGGTTPSDISAPGSNDSRTKLTRSTKQSGKGSKDASRAEPSDTDKVAAAGNTIESAPKNDERLAAPEADADESEGSILSSTGAQILAWLVLACLLIAIGAALVRRGRTGSRA
jgi:cobalamin biosynthesis Mg chelatase CobN